MSPFYENIDSAITDLVTILLGLHTFDLEVVQILHLRPTEPQRPDGR